MIRMFKARRVAYASAAFALLLGFAQAEPPLDWTLGDGGSVARTDIVDGAAGGLAVGSLRLFCKDQRHLQFAVDIDGNANGRVVVTDGVGNEATLFEARLTGRGELPDLPAAIALSKLLRTTLDQYERAGYGDEDMFLGLAIGAKAGHTFSLRGFREARARLLRGCGGGNAPAMATAPRGGSYPGTDRIVANCRQRNTAEQCQCAVASIERFALSKRQHAGPNVVRFMFEGAAAMIDNMERGRSQDASISAVTLIAMRYMVHARMASSFAPVQMVAQALMRAEQECRLR